MQAAAAVVANGGPSAPMRRAWSTETYRRRPGIVREDDGLEQLSVTGAGGLLEQARSCRRRPWVLPAVDIGRRPHARGQGQRWPFRTSPHVVLAFLGWLVEGGLKPTKRGPLVTWARNRWIWGARVSWAQLLGCSVRSITRMVAELAELGLVEQQRAVVQVSRRQCREVPAAYRPGPALLAWLQGEAPAFLSNRTRMPASGAPTPPSGVSGADVVDLTRATDAASVAPENELSPSDSTPTGARGELSDGGDVGEKRNRRAVGAVERASAAAGDNAPPQGPRLVPATVSASPAAPPAGPPPGPPVAADELRAMARSWLSRASVVDGPPVPEELEAARARARRGVALRWWERWLELWREVGAAAGGAT